MTFRLFLLACAALLSTPLSSQEPPRKASPSSAVETQQPVKTPVPAARGGEGQRVFQEQCSRCHNAPEGFPPRISGTIVRHMRVRASLSQHDEAELLRFLNP